MRFDVAAPIVLAILVGGLVLLSTAAAARRATVNANARRRQRLEAELRPRLLRLLASEEPDLAVLAPRRRRARGVLEGLATGLLPKLRGSDRSGVVELLESCGAVERARRATKSHRAVVRARAVEQLGNIGLHGTQQDIARLLHDRHVEVRGASARALGKLGDTEAVASLLRALDRGQVSTNVVSMALMRLGPQAVGQLEVGLRASGATSRIVCCELLGLLGALAAVPALAQVAVAGEDPQARLAAIRALGRVGSPAGLEPLLTCLCAGGPAVRAEAARSLGRLGMPTAIPSLEAALDDEHDVAFAASAALAAHGPKGAERLEVVSASATSAGRHASAALSVAAMESARRRQVEPAGAR